MKPSQMMSPLLSHRDDHSSRAPRASRTSGPQTERQVDGTSPSAQLTAVAAHRARRISSTPLSSSRGAVTLTGPAAVTPMRRRWQLRTTRRCQRPVRARGRHLMAFFGCLYYAANRPGEATNLRDDGRGLLGDGHDLAHLGRSLGAAMAGACGSSSPLPTSRQGQDAFREGLHGERLVELFHVPVVILDQVDGGSPSRESPVCKGLAGLSRGGEQTWGLPLQFRQTEADCPAIARVCAGRGVAVGSGSISTR